MSTSIAARTAAAARRACWLRCALVVLAARTPDSFFALRAFSELAALRAFARPALPPTFAPAFFFAAGLLRARGLARLRPPGLAPDLRAGLLLRRGPAGLLGGLDHVVQRHPQRLLG